MKKLNTIVGVLIVATLITSCSTSNDVVTGNFIQKRKYNKGFFVNNIGKVETLKKAENSQKRLSASTIHLDKKETIFSRPAEKLNPTAIDNSLIASLDEGNIGLSIYSMLELNSSIPFINNSNQSLVSNISQKQQNKFEKKLTTLNDKLSSKHANPSGGGKSQMVALLLCIFIGGLGIHRFYLGYTGIGVIQLLTLGGCGIWSLIDLIRIIVGDLGPNNGSYSSTF